MAAMEMATRDEIQRRVVLLHRLAWACAVLVLVITSLSAFVRLSKAGVGCEPWPQCQAERAHATAGMATQPESGAVVGARIAHRIATSGTMLLIIAMLMIALARQPSLREPGRLVLALLGLALFLALLGRLARDAPAPAVTLGNLLGGMGMVAVGWHLVQVTRARDVVQAAGPPRAWVLAALVLVALQLALGALVSAGQLASTCADSLTCNAHRGSALVIVLVLGAITAAAWRKRRGPALLLLLLVLAQAALGVTMLTLALPLPLALAHNVLSALLIAALVGLL